MDADIIQFLSETDSEEEKFWDYFDYDSIGYLNKIFNSIAPRLLEYLLLSVFRNETIDIGAFTEGKKRGAAITYDQYYTDKQLNLRLLSKTNYELELILRDREQEIVKWHYKLSKGEINNIPEGLRNIMKDVIRTDEPKSININNLK